jgi:hypothetical protein
VLREDDQGLWSEIIVAEGEPARGFLESIRRGDVTGMSFLFRTVVEEWNEEDQERTLIEVKLYEVSPTPFPAYPTTSAGVRSMFPDLPDDNSIRHHIEFLRACLPVDHQAPITAPVEPAPERSGRHPGDGVEPALLDGRHPPSRQRSHLTVVQRQLYLYERENRWI